MTLTLTAVKRAALLATAFVFVVAATPAKTPAKTRALAELASWEALAKTAPQKTPLRVVNVWATWCVPCVAEMPDLQKIDDRFQDTDVELLGISLDDVIPGDRAAHKKKVVKFLTDRKIRFTNLYFTGKPSKIQEALNFEGEIPVTVIYDRSGRELWRHQGRIDREALVRTIEGFRTRRK
jgi:thiol-disulfide isomerase/thioredoxin